MSRNELEQQIPLARNALEAATQLGGEGRIRTFGARDKKTRPTGCYHPVRSTALPPLRTLGSLAATASCLPPTSVNLD